jgi:biopolymer transport protein ExbB
MFKNENIIEILSMGGIAMLFLVICLVIVTAIVIDRWWYLRTLRNSLYNLFYDLRKAIVRGNINEVITICESGRPPISTIFKEGIIRSDKSKDDIFEALESTRLKELKSLKKRVWIVGTVGNIAPFIGLFGTIIGIIKVFDQIAIESSGSFSVVSAGIAEALIATAGGLAVAIIAVIAYNYLANKINGLSQDIKYTNLQLTELLNENPLNTEIEWRGSENEEIVLSSRRNE